jgi:hypothetical protein
LAGMVVNGVRGYLQEDPVNDLRHVPDHSTGEFRHASAAIEVSKICQHTTAHDRTRRTQTAHRPHTAQKMWIHR